MRLFDHFDLAGTVNTAAVLALAFALGALIGLERQYRRHTAGLRTNALVAVGAALFVDIALRFNQIYGGSPGALQVVAYVVSGVGFLGAGVIMRDGGNIRGINTAATLWCSAAVGVAAGCGLVLEALLGTMFVLLANTLLRPVVNAIKRQPMDLEVAEITYSLYLIAERAQQKAVLRALSVLLDREHCPVQEIEVQPFGEQEVEIEAILALTSIDAEALAALAVKLAQIPGVRQAYSSSSASD